MAYRDKQLLEDIYDYLKETALPVKQSDEWGKLSREHALEARKNLGEYLRQKNMEWDPISNTIKIGDRVTLRLEVK